MFKFDHPEETNLPRTELWLSSLENKVEFWILEVNRNLKRYFVHSSNLDIISIDKTIVFISVSHDRVKPWILRIKKNIMILA